MDSEASDALEILGKNLILSKSELEKLAANYGDYREEVEALLAEFRKHKQASAELSSLNSRSARLNYELYETYMAVHTNSIKISGSRSALRIAGQRLSQETEIEIEEILEKYLMMKF